VTWPTAFVWTCALELPVYELVLGRHFRRWSTLCLMVPAPLAAPSLPAPARAPAAANVFSTLVGLLVG
jgi:hypothetical protein